MNPKKKHNTLIFDVLTSTRSDTPGMQYQHQLQLLNLHNNKYTTLLERPDGNSFSFSFSPHTNLLALTLYGNDATGSIQFSKVVFYNLENKKQVTGHSLFPTGYNFVKNPVFSPSGKQLAIEVAYNSNSLYNPDLMIYNLVDHLNGDFLSGFMNGMITNPDRIGIFSPQFFPDGQRLVYLRNYSYHTALEVCFCNTTIRTDAENFLDFFGAFSKHRLTFKADVPWNRHASLVLDSLTEKAFFIRGHNDYKYEQICIVDCHSDAVQNPSSSRSISENFTNIRGIYMSPNYQQIAFIGDGQLFISAPDGGDLKAITNHDANCTVASFAPNGESLIYANSSGIWMISDLKKTTAELIFPISKGRISELLWI